MILRNILAVLYAFFAVSQFVYSIEVSYNLVNLSSCAKWETDSTKFGEINVELLLGSYLFIDKNNSVYVIDQNHQCLIEWPNGNDSISTTQIFQAPFIQRGLFVSSTGDIYTSADEYGTVIKWSHGNETFEIVTEFGLACNHMFISINDLIYCSITSYNIVGTKPLDHHSNLMTIIAGVGITGTEAHMLDGPTGIFVDTNLDLYVADIYNNRIQLFYPGNINGIAIPDPSDTFKLNQPRSVVLDANKQIYILEDKTRRIVVKTHQGFRCLLGCNKIGSSPDIFSWHAMAFDNYGNIFVSDWSTNRIQKHLLLKNTCDSNENIEMITASPMTTMTSTTGSVIGIQSVYESILTTNIPDYSVDCSSSLIYYENIEMCVDKQGNYELTLNSTKEISIYVFKNDFNPTNLLGELLLRHLTGCDICQIKFSINLQSNRTYQVVIATLTQNPNVSFLITSIGLSKTSFSRNDILPVQTIYSSALTNESHPCSRDDCGLTNFYCEVLEIDVLETGYYTIMSNSTMHVYGYIYENNFTLFNLDINKIKTDVDKNCKYQFIKSMHRQKNTSFILIVTTRGRNEVGEFSITVNGPTDVNIKQIKNLIRSDIETMDSSQLSNTSQKFDNLNCYFLNTYYQAFDIKVNTSGYYLFSLHGDFDLKGHLFEHYFNPYNSQETHLIRYGDFCAEDEPRSVVYLQSSNTYVLIITTLFTRHYEEGPFTVIAKGPDRVLFKPTDDTPVVFQSIISEMKPNQNHQLYNPEDCRYPRYKYESVQINIIQSGNYTLSSVYRQEVRAFLYQQHFNPTNPSERLYSFNHGGCPFKQFKIAVSLRASLTYILIMIRETRLSSPFYKSSMILVTGPNSVVFNQIILQTRYSSELTKDHQLYSRECKQEKYYYETIEMNVQHNGSYTFDSNSSIPFYGYIYENTFDPSYPHKNLIAQSNFSCQNHFQLGNYLEMNRKYILVVTTFHPNVRGSFTVSVTGPNNVTLNRFVEKHSTCIVGDQCNFYTKSIGLTINDILRGQIQANLSFIKQSSLTQVAAGITMLMFIIGLINGIFSLVTFKNKDLRKIGCGIYLLASAVTSLLTTTMFTVKFWFVVLIQLHSTVRSSMLRTDCLFIGPFLKVCLYLDGWFNACVAMERTVTVSKGVTFEKKRSRRMARWLILILPILVIGSMIHEPIHHQLFEYTISRYQSTNNHSMTNMSIENSSDSFQLINEQHVLCVIRYSASLQTYDTIILYFHVTAPFVANLCSALFIVFGTARRRSTAQGNKRTFKEHIFDQTREHKQLLISPIILLLLAIPRLIMSLISGCVDPSTNPWLYLCGYFISATPPMLIFTVFVLPSKLYMETFKESITRLRRQNRQ